MSEKEQLLSAVGEVNRLIAGLLERKEELYTRINGMNQIGGESEETLPGGTYGAYLHALEERQDRIVSSPRVVYQGDPGAYSEMAAIDFFGPEVHAKGMLRFQDPFLALKNGEADYAVMPIENSSTGAIRQVYDLLSQYNFFLVGETTVAVNHSLMALPGVELDEIDTVYSHEQGLFQCEQFLAKHSDWKRIPQADTAGSAKLVAEQQKRNVAAICSPLAAEIYGLHVLEHNINTNMHNTTRFVVVSPRMELPEGRDKICVSLTVSHQSGSLHDILTVFAVHGVNLVRLESRPIPERNWEYMFFIEFTGDLKQKNVDEVIHEIALIAGDLRVLGNFKSNLEGR